MHAPMSSTLLLALFPFISAIPLDVRQLASTANDLENGGCKPVSVIFARGTTEPGNIGTVVGPPMEAALQQKLGASNVAFQGVDYPASVPGFLAGGSPGGAS
jgi:cutinase